MLNTYNFSVYLNSLRQKGNLAFEYNPLYNFQTDVDLYKIDDKYIVPYGLAVNTKNGELLIQKNGKWVDKRGMEISSKNVKVWNQGDLWAKSGSLIDLDTEKLNFDIDHPVNIEVLPSYDGSVNLILNDDKNIPRLINSRFSVREKNTYEIVDRIGENDTNIYNSRTFDKDTSLYFLYEYNPKITYLGFIKGNLEVGQYCFYFTYCDADDNESDIIAESGLIPVFVGNDSDPNSMDGGIKNQVSDKGIRLKLTDIDKSYNYFKVYYVRYFADYQLNRVYECKKIYLKYPINSNTIYLNVTGYEDSEELDPNILNISRFNPKSILTLALCKNMLFFGNIVKNTDNYKELTDLALRIVTELNIVNNFDNLDEDYITSDGSYAYYNSLNIYNKTGYFNQEYYRFGVVFIYLNGTLSNVYNTLGGTLDDGNNKLNLTSDGLFRKDGYYLIRNYIKCDEFGWVKEDNNYSLSGENINAKGVCHINYNNEYNDKTIFSIKFKVPKDVSKFLKEDLGIRGFFFVRQKCVPNIIALCYLMPMDEQSLGPIIEYTENNKSKYISECFLSLSLIEIEKFTLPKLSGITIEKTHKYGGRIVTNDYNSRIYEFSLDSNSISKKAYAAICPDFLLNLPYYNQIFNGGKFRLLKISTKNSKLVKDDRFYKEPSNVTYNIGNNEGFRKVSICSVTDNVRTIAIKDKIYRLEMGKTEEVYRFRFAENDTEAQDLGKDNSEKDSCNLIRGIYSPYLAVYSNSGQLETGCLYNILYDSNISVLQEFLNRMNSSEPFYAISDRQNLVILDYEYLCYRGDCYINKFTYRLNRNFNDPSLPNNDLIIDPATWYSNYDNPDNWTNISRSDVNAVQMGSWITISVRSAMNYALRSVDHSYVSEEALMGAPRSFYPKSHLLFRGENKIPDSYLYNDAYRATLGYKCYFTLQDINYIKDTFSNRIQYSAISVQDSYKNNYRYSLSTYYRDYSLEYGSILKLVEYGDGIIVVFEHGIGFAAVNERVLAGQGEGGPVFINADKVLPEELQILSNTYGTQWGDSVVKSEAGYIYGVDTVAKKIWRIRGNQIDIISDFKVNKFLINNITLGERELYPTIGLRNVKTHYNNNKKDIIFTFYDDVYKDEERVWSLCFNELMPTDGAFTTFYSWVPSFSENIDTQFFTFDRTTSKYLSLLYKCNYSVPENLGILLDSPVIDDEGGIPDVLCNIYYTTINKSFVSNYTVLNLDGTTSIKSITVDGIKDVLDRYIFNKFISYKIEKDHWGNYKFFEIKNGLLKIKDEFITNNREIIEEIFLNLKVIVLYVTPMTYNSDDVIGETYAGVEFETEAVAFTLDSIVKNPLLTIQEKKRQGLTTDFYLHGKAGIFNVVEDLYPTHWYGKYHPFEFEFVVNDKLSLLKIFTDLIILSNKAEPESFHFEIEGDNYDFSPDKRNMYFRLEATKNLYLNLGSDILYDRYFTDVIADNYTHELYYRANPSRRNSEDILSNDYIDSYRRMDKVYPLDSQGLVLQVKSTIFPLYYERIDTYDDIYHKYRLMDGGDEYDFKNLSGSEIIWDRDLNQFNIVTHIKNNPIDHYGVLRGNSKYKEGKWNIQIPAISFMLKNEGDTWQEASSKPNTTPITVPGLFVLADCNGEGGSVLCGSDVLVCDNTPKDYFILADCNGEGGSELCGDALLGYVSINDYSNGYKEANFDKDPEDFTLNLSILDLVDTLVCGESNNTSNLQQQSLLGTPRRNVMRNNSGEQEEEIKNEILKYKIPPIVINSSYLPKDLDTTLVSPDRLPNIYNTVRNYQDLIEVDGWTHRKETKIRDKWVKIRVRYSGKNLAVIHSLITLYNISYS